MSSSTSIDTTGGPMHARSGSGGILERVGLADGEAFLPAGLRTPLPSPTHSSTGSPTSPSLVRADSALVGLVNSPKGETNTRPSKFQILNIDTEVRGLLGILSRLNTEDDMYLNTVKMYINFIKTVMERVNLSGYHRHCSTIEDKSAFSRIHDLKELLRTVGPLLVDGADLNDLSSALKTYALSYSYETNFNESAKDSDARSVGAMIQDYCLPEVQLIAASKGKTINFEISEELKTCILSDAKKGIYLRSILFNLIANALEHGNGDVTVSVQPDGDKIAFSVADQGIPLHEKTVQKVFGLSPETPEPKDDTESKRDADSPSDSWGVGTGTAFEIGRLSFEISSCGQTKFEPGKSLWFKVTKASLTGRYSPKIVSTASTETEKPKVLVVVVDDLASKARPIQRYIKQAAKNNVPDIKYYETGEGVLDELSAFLDEKKYDKFIIFSDVNMPRTTGTELLTELSKDEKLKPHTQFYFHTEVDDSATAILKSATECRLTCGQINMKGATINVSSLKYIFLKAYEDALTQIPPEASKEKDTASAGGDAAGGQTKVTPASVEDTTGTATCDGEAAGAGAGSAPDQAPGGREETPPDCLRPIRVTPPPPPSPPPKDAIAMRKPAATSTATDITGEADNTP